MTRERAAAREYPEPRRSSTSFPHDPHQLRSLPGFQIDRQQIADARGVELVLDVAGRQRRALLGLEAVIERAVGDRGGVGETLHLRQVFRLTEEELLAVE